MVQIAIIGNGFVGKATALLRNKDVNVIVYDIIPSLCDPIGTTLKDLKSSDFIFICVPTPMKEDGSCSISYVKTVLEELKKVNITSDAHCIILRSTVPVGTCKKLNVNFMPEFLTERNWKNDFRSNKDWIFGLLNPDDIELKSRLNELFSICYKNVSLLMEGHLHFVSTNEAEMCKYVRNSFLGVKVSFFNEIEEYCRKNSLDFENVRKISVLDKRIGSSHTKVPGIDNKRGFGGICLPKDLNSLIHQFEPDITPHILKAVKFRNENIDRSEKDWFLDKGRAVV